MTSPTVYKPFKNKPVGELSLSASPVLSFPVASLEHATWDAAGRGNYCLLPTRCILYWSAPARDVRFKEL